jgi:hypothetical protein
MHGEEPLNIFLIRRWDNGDSMLPLVQRLMERGSTIEAGVAARLALAKPDCQDREALEAALHMIANEPAGWEAALQDFARNPSMERWDDLMQFVDEEDFYQRFRTTVSFLMREGCDGDILFKCAAKNGMFPDLFDLAQSGTVDPEVIRERGEDSPARGAWLGLAAQASFARGDRWGTIRYLRDAVRDDESAAFALASISEIRADAEEELNEALDRVGVPRV